MNPLYAAQNTKQVVLIPNAIIPGTENPQDFTDFVGGLLPQIITVLVLLTVISLAWWGIGYFLKNIPGFKSYAKTRIWDIILGLILIFGAYLILQVVNPNINNSKIFDNSLNQIKNSSPAQ